MGRRWGLVGVVVSVAALWAAGGSGAGTTTVVSIPTGAVIDNVDSMGPSVSDDGRYVAFTSSASNIVPGDTNGVQDVFVYDRVSYTYERASVGAGGSQLSEGSYQPSISGDGRFVAYVTEEQLDQLPGVPVARIYSRDRLLGTVQSVANGNDGQRPNGASYLPDVSDDGRFVAFQSFATNLAPGFVFSMQTYLFDTVSLGTTLVSRGLGGSGVGSELSRISGNGRYVAFASSSADLVPADTPDVQHVYVYDRASGTNEKADVANGVEGDQGVDLAGPPSISSDGRLVAFASLARNLGPDETCVDRGGNCVDAFVRDRSASTTTLVTPSLQEATSLGIAPLRDVLAPQLSADGHQLLVRWFDYADIIRRDLVTGGLSRESVSTTGTPGDGNRGNLVVTVDLSSDGSVIVFDSNSSNLDPLDTNRCDPPAPPNSPPHSCWDIFVRLPFASTGGGGGGGGGVPDLKAGLTASKTTVAAGEESDLVATVTNAGTQTSQRTHVFITLPASMTLLGPPAFDRGSGCTGSQTIDCNLDFLPVGVATKVVFAVRVGGQGTITATASGDKETNPADNTAAIAFQLTPPPTPPTRTPSSSKGVTLTGTTRADILAGTAYPDVLRGLGGNDSIKGKASADKLYGGKGNDTIVGGTGPDLFEGGAGDDRVFARDGQRDTIRCGTGKDTVTADKKDTVSRDCERVRRP